MGAGRVGTQKKQRCGRVGSTGEPLLPLHSGSTQGTNHNIMGFQKIKVQTQEYTQQTRNLAEDNFCSRWSTADCCSPFTIQSDQCNIVPGQTKFSEIMKTLLSSCLEFLPYFVSAWLVGLELLISLFSLVWTRNILIWYSCRVFVANSGRCRALCCDSRARD